MGKIGQMFMLRLLLFTLLLLLLLLHIFNVLHGDTNDLVRMRPLLKNQNHALIASAFQFKIDHLGVGGGVGTSLFPLFGNGSGVSGAVSWMD